MNLCFPKGWKYGPVISRVYNEFSHYKDKPIDEFYKDSKGMSYKLKEESNPIFSKVLYRIWEKYKYYSGIELSKITHEVGSAWYKAWCNSEIYINDEDIISENVG